MGYDYEPPGQDAISGKKLAILFIVALIGAILFIQVLFGFPFLDIFRRDVIEYATVITAGDSTDKKPKPIGLYS